MGKLIRRILALLCIGAIGATTFGLSYFYFEDNKETSNTQNNLKVDDIEENYRFNKTTSTDTTYTIYFFPSAAYMSLYYKYLNNTTEIAPEKQFGYKEVQYNEKGNILLDNNGNARYKLSSETGEYANYTRSTYTVSYDGAYRKYIGDEFPCDDFEADGGTAYGSGTAYTSTQSAISADSDGKKRTWGVPNEGMTFKDNTEANIENYNGHNQFSLDRLGCWDDCYYYGYTVSDSDGDNAPTGLIEGDSPSLSTLMDDTNTGRYLPIKITITNTMSTSVMEKAVQDIFSSMGNSNDHHNYSFTQWTYVDTSTSAPSYPYGVDSDGCTTNKERKDLKGADDKNYPVGDAFQPIPTNRYFDMFSDLSKYADSNGVIRLFPLFSNGKKTNATSYVNGGGAAQKLQISYTTDSTTTNEYKYPFFNSDIYNGVSYEDTTSTDSSTDSSTDTDSTDSDDTTDSTDTTTASDCFTYTDSSETETTVPLLLSKYIRMFSYYNVKIKSSDNVSSLKFTANNIWNSPANWQSEDGSILWRNLYTLDSTYIQDQLISKYGEGLYTFYVFVANYSYENGPNNMTKNETEMRKTFQPFYDNIVSQAMEGKFASVKGKNLVQVTAVDSSMGSYECSPTVVAFEKIDEPKVINDFPVSESSYSTATVSDVNSTIADDYEYAPGFYRNQEPLYKGTKSGSAYSIDGDDLSTTEPYTYIARNVDFMNDESLYFLIAFSESYSTTHAFNAKADMEYEYLISNPTKSSDSDTYTISPEDVFTEAYEYIEAVDATGDDGKTYQMLKFKNNEYLGIYDILIKYNKNKGKYDIYMFRHSNLFCYVFDKKLTDYSTGTFVDHSFNNSYVNEAANATLLFENRYFIGESLKASDKSTSNNSDSNLDECLRNYIGGSKDYSGEKLLNYQLMDRVTDTVVAQYKQNTDGTYTLECNLRIYKNYIFYIADKTA